MNESAKPEPPAIQANALDRLRGDDSSRWPNIADANSLSRDKLALFAEIARKVRLRDDCSLIVFGSLARREFTQKSDVDWALMVDGHACSADLNIVHSLRSELKNAGLYEPGPTEVFGGLYQDSLIRTRRPIRACRWT
jgi:predicted nucleotidyltransferase